MNWTVFLFCLLPLGLIIVALIRNQRIKERALQEATANLQEAKADYEVALLALKVEPSNNDLRQQALVAGRRLVSLARDNRSSVFDEVSLMNDLNAIQAMNSLAQTAPHLNTQDISFRLLRLEELLKAGTISQEEYQTRRSAILDQI